MRGNPWRPDGLQLCGNPNYQEAEMAYERLDEALRQLKTDREREEAKCATDAVGRLVTHLFEEK
jgi:hypothetical protein